MARPPDLARVRDRVRRGEERAVQPPPALADKLGKRVGHVGLADRALDVPQNPGVALASKAADGEATGAYQFESALATSSKQRIRWVE